MAVRNEAERGDNDAARRRLAAIEDVPALDVPATAVALAKDLTRNGAVPAESAEDALHIALAAVYGMRYLATWNFRHINNHATRTKASEIVNAAGYEAAIIISPEEMLEIGT